MIPGNSHPSASGTGWRAKKMACFGISCAFSWAWTRLLVCQGPNKSAGEENYFGNDKGAATPDGNGTWTELPASELVPVALEPATELVCSLIGHRSIIGVQRYIVGLFGHRLWRRMDTTSKVDRRSHQWDGKLLSHGPDPSSPLERNQLAGAAKAGRWDEVLELLTNNSFLVNSVRPDSRTGFTPLHQAAYNNAPHDVIRQLIAFGAFRTLKNSSGLRPVDIARDKGFHDCMGFLEPEILHPVDAARLAFIQELFHGLVRATMLGYNIVEPLRLPQLSVLTEFGDDSLWFPIPGMFGGFNLWFEGNGRDAVLWAESWSRMVNGSGMRHRITPVEIILVEEGFA